MEAVDEVNITKFKNHDKKLKNQWQIYSWSPHFINRWRVFHGIFGESLLNYV